MLKIAFIEKQFQYKGRDCICVFNRDGFRCGYVSVKRLGSFDELDIKCHGGLNFEGILSEAYMPRALYYVGFDCGHICDGRDFELAYQRGMITEIERDFSIGAFAYLLGKPVRSLEYVENECKKIVDQLEEKSNGKKNHF